MTGTTPNDTLVATDIRKTFRRSNGLFSPASETRALKGVSFEVTPGEIFGIVGESGCGKSTLARILVGLEEADGGSLALGARTLFGPGAPTVSAVNRGIQMVFQDPYASLNPRMCVGDAVAEGLAIANVPRAEREERVAETLSLVGLTPQDARKYPFQFSGGQRQRICIARALVMEPAFLLADEAVSALDVSVQMQILNMLLDLRDRIGVSIIFITHDISVVDYLCDRVMVVYDGEVVEFGEKTAVLDHPQNAYTQRLIQSVPRL
ncbi:peptide/nickel transport system ATP-binding protein/dipeptide transport system ATP-binding protein [Lutimaribacter pacificus]|uniref:Peptide/nickel transport system ATP-binding protein/dipeptide transport system ATP-binding protein n=1 Tax=Lutimaribacter pacificus TaxID=391948 RepID=A0A1H0GFS3_9RHOB|nr:ATP-binding cassette domain-containing protein [Lutimaribacter pacificus]SDO05750.1 peptide/nickel transport system ATP-binding protein/dipeptide transport system ATP-binding protein [Lutimaribacter pacificus]SHJ87874.1 peptide/nickel transport system ATP-binding protein/dipeptide transport system ATP-binding protein [Lutimaribacter pacificus]